MSSITCSEARETIWPIRGPKLVGGPIEEAQRHVEGCAACRDYLAQNHVLRDAYDSLDDVHAPIALRERVIAAIAHERARLEGGDRPVSASQSAKAERQSAVPANESGGPRDGRRERRHSILSAGRVAIAAGVVLVVAGTIARAATTADPDPETGTVFVEDYLRRAVGQDQIHTSDPATVRQWLTRELGVALRPLEMVGLELEGAEICLLEGRRGAMIVYKLDGARISHYLVPREGVEERAPTIGWASMEQNGMVPPLVTWSTPSVEQALVGELTSERLLEVARASF